MRPSQGDRSTEWRHEGRELISSHPLTDLFQSIGRKAVPKHAFKSIDGTVKCLFTAEQHRGFLQQRRIPIRRNPQLLINRSSHNWSFPAERLPQPGETTSRPTSQTHQNCPVHLQSSCSLPASMPCLIRIVYTREASHEGNFRTRPVFKRLTPQVRSHFLRSVPEPSALILNSSARMHATSPEFCGGRGNGRGVCLEGQSESSSPRMPESFAYRFFNSTSTLGCS